MTEHEWEEQEKAAYRKAKWDRKIDYILLIALVVLALGLVAVGLWYLL